MTKLAAISIYGKYFKNLLFRNQKGNELECLYTALVTQMLLSLFKCWPNALVWEKGKKKKKKNQKLL